MVGIGAYVYTNNSKAQGSWQAAGVIKTPYHGIFNTFICEVPIGTDTNTYIVKGYAVDVSHNVTNQSLNDNVTLTMWDLNHSSQVVHEQSISHWTDKTTPILQENMNLNYNGLGNDTTNKFHFEVTDYNPVNKGLVTGLNTQTFANDWKNNSIPHCPGF